VTVFSPEDLFAASEVGVWYDPSPETTFTDTAGTTAATVGSAVALMLDKSKGLVLGPELVDTANLATSWTAFGSNLITQDGDEVRVEFVDNAGGGFVVLSAVGGLSENTVVGKFYELTGLARVNTGSANVKIGGNLSPANTDIFTTSSVTAVPFNAVFQSTGANPNIQFSGLGAGEVIWISNISVKELPGYHATQATAAARPILARVPASGRRNLLTRTEEFDNAVWAKAVEVTVTPNAVLAPDGTMTADILAGPNNRAVTTPGVLDGQVKSIWARTVSGTGTIALLGYFSLAKHQFTLTEEWQRFEVPSDVADTGGTNFYAVDFRFGTLSEVVIWGAQLELGSTATDYQRVTSTYDVTEAGQADNYHLVFDGVDDSMSTPSVDLTATNQMSVFAGVGQVNLSGGRGAVFNTNAGNFNSFALFTPSATANQIQAIAFGDSGGGAFSLAESGVASPLIAAALSANTSLTSTANVLRRDGAVVVSGGVAGAGNYTNNPFHIGHRGGSSFINGQIYSLIVRGALTADNLLNQTETYVASKTAGIFTSSQVTWDSSTDTYTQTDFTLGAE
jgi:hypothetical protein